MGVLRADVFGEGFFFAGDAVSYADLALLAVAAGGGEEEDLAAVGTFGAGVEVGVDGVAGGVRRDGMDADAGAPRGEGVLGGVEEWDEGEGAEEGKNAGGILSGGQPEVK